MVSREVKAVLSQIYHFLARLLMLAVEMGAEPVDRARWDECCERNRSNFALGATWGLPVNRA